uniref:PP28 domain-containing protein n=1 Tax=Macrostomum lignano TaxID=282301 RepID=A0A1I8GP65_9PLAT
GDEKREEEPAAVVAQNLDDPVQSPEVVGEWKEEHTDGQHQGGAAVPETTENVEGDPVAEGITAEEPQKDKKKKKKNKKKKKKAEQIDESQQRESVEAAPEDNADKNYQADAADKDKSNAKAAVKIQAGFRGMQARKEAAELRKQQRNTAEAALTTQTTDEASNQE